MKSPSFMKTEEINEEFQAAYQSRTVLMIASHLRFLLLLAAFLLGAAGIHAQPNAIPYSFFIAGHTSGKSGINNIGLHPPFKNQFGYIQGRPEIKFGVFTGDIVGDNPTSQDWDEIGGDIDSLGLPVYFAVGNHDMERRRLYERRYGRTYSSFTFQDDLFIILDPNIEGWSIRDEQLRFLNTVVAQNQSTKNNIFVFFHQVLWKNLDGRFQHIAWNSASGRIRPVNFWSTIVPIFTSLPNDVYMFAGDLGASWASAISYDMNNNITLISSGMGDTSTENFVIINVNADKAVNFDLICLSDTNSNCLGSLTDHLKVSESSPSPEPQILISYEDIGQMVYPNPARRTIYFTPKAKSNRLLIYSSNGTLVLEKRGLEKAEHKLDVGHLSKGLYTVRIISELGQSTSKLLLE